MAFNSIIFTFFFMPIVVLFHYIIQHKYKACFLIVASLFFYAYYDFRMIPHLVLFITIVYFYSLILKNTKYKKIVLALGISSLIGYLLYYKYLSFLVGIINSAFGKDLPTFENVISPLGVSFYTFSAIAFLVDSYRSNTNSSFTEFFNYIAFFPKIVSGPILSLTTFRGESITLANISKGINRFVVGLSKKTILSYYFGLTADSVWQNLRFGIDTPTAWIGAIAYSLQLYFDFSGYSDMAIGISSMLGYPLSENFNFPYESKSISEFWRRWHISLGVWFRNYIYFPLGGSRRGNAYINLLIVFAITGIWHGANWTFIIWGLWHGLLRLMEKTIQNTKIYQVIPGIVKWFFTMLAVLIGWVLFRSASISEAFEYLNIMAGIQSVPKTSIIFSWEYFLNNRTIFLGIVGILGATVFGKTKIYKLWISLEDISCINTKMYTVQSIILFGLAGLSLMMILTSKHVPFIYFQF